MGWGLAQKGKRTKVTDGDGFMLSGGGKLLMQIEKAGAICIGCYVAGYVSVAQPDNRSLINPFMSLLAFKPQFDNAYEEFFQKALVAKKIANIRFEKVLKFGTSVPRVAYDISGVRVRTVTRGAASTIDALTDCTETLTVNLEEAVFHISDGEAVQAGPLKPGEVIGAQVAVNHSC